MKTKRIFSIIAFVLLIVTLTSVLSGCYSFTYNGISSTSINEKGELIIKYTNGNEQNLGVVVGSDGKDGADGSSTNSGNTVIQGSGADVALAVSKATRSAVSVSAAFKNAFGQESYSSGSGVIYKYNEEVDGYFIITNYHVVYDASLGISQDINVFVYGNEYLDGKMSAKYVGGSLNYDIAVLFVENNDVLKSSSITTAEVYSSNKISIGDTAIAVGNARGEGISATTGVISVDSETLNMTGADEKTQVSFRVMRTDASVNKGNSGGGLFNDKGQLIGIVNAKIIVSGVEGIGYAIPSTVACNVADNIIDNCYGKLNTVVKRALLGITVSVSQSVSVYDPDTGKISIRETVYIVEATSTNLFGANIMANDVIKSIKLDRLEKLEVTRQFHVIDYLLQARVGDTGTLTVERTDENGQTKDVELRFTITEGCIVNYN